jgi:hypothetical protein
MAHQHAEGALLVLLRHRRISRCARLCDAHQRSDHALEQVGALQVAVVVHKEVHLQPKRCTVNGLYQHCTFAWTCKGSEHDTSRPFNIYFKAQLQGDHQQLAIACERLEAPQHHATLAQVHGRRRCVTEKEQVVSVKVPGQSLSDSFRTIQSKLSCIYMQLHIFSTSVLCKWRC